MVLAARAWPARCEAVAWHGDHQAMHPIRLQTARFLVGTAPILMMAMTIAAMGSGSGRGRGHGGTVLVGVGVGVVVAAAAAAVAVAVAVVVPSGSVSRPYMFLSGTGPCENSTAPKLHWAHYILHVDFARQARHFQTVLRTLRSIHMAGTAFH